MIDHRTRAPGLPQGVTKRPRLDQLFASFLEDHQAIAVVGAAGSGKTVQAQLFAAGWGAPTAWLTLDERDRSGTRLLSDLELTLTPCAPDARDLVEHSLRAGYDSEEVAVLLAEATYDQQLLVVLDDSEAIFDEGEAAEVVAAFVSHLGPSVRVLMLSRQELPPAVARLAIDGRIAKVTDRDLKLTRSEAAAVLAARGHDVSVDEALEVTGGWLTGIVFWPGESAVGRGIEDLTAFLCHEVLDRLGEADQRFLLDTSILRSVSPQAAVAVSGDDIGPVWRLLVDHPLPATTTGDGSLVYHPAFRSFLLEQLKARDPARLVSLQHSYAAYLMGSAQYEEATEQYLALGDLDAATASAELSLEAMCERADWPAILRWLEALGEERIRWRPRLLAARLRALHGSRRYDETRRLIREGEQRGWFRLATDADPDLLGATVWVVQNEPAEAMRLLDTYRGNYRADAARFMIAACSGVEPAVPPRGAGWANMEHLIRWGLLLQGRVGELTRSVDPEAEGPIIDTTILMAMISKGDLDEADRAWDRVPEQIRDRAQTLFARSWLLHAHGDNIGALALVTAALAESRLSGFGLDTVYMVFSARILQCLGRFDEASHVLTNVMPTIQSQGKRFLIEWVQTLIGFDHLERGELRRAELVLREAITAMRRSGRLLFLPMAGLYLSEVQAHLGDLEASTAAAALALDTAERTGAFHWVTAALAEVPEVAARQASAGGPTSRWKRMAPQPSATTSRAGQAEPGTVSLELQPFGAHPDLLLDGTPLHIGRLKVIELVAYTALHPGGSGRLELLGQLFPDVDPSRGANHFRQIAHKLQRFTGIRLIRAEGGAIRWPDYVRLESADMRFEQLVNAGIAAPPAKRLDCLRAALAVINGEYLEKSDLLWAEQRRNQIRVCREDALRQAISLSTDLGDYDGARELAELLLQLSSLSQEAFRVLFEVEQVIGTEASAMAVYRRAARAFEDTALSPEEIRELLCGDRLPFFTSSTRGRH
jgi:DNA-binding SARP family transcriptional activator